MPQPHLSLLSSLISSPHFEFLIRLVRVDGVSLLTTPDL